MQLGVCIMEKLEGMISDIVFKNEENGYTIACLLYTSITTQTQK